jgi:hypothetical protein
MNRIFVKLYLLFALAVLFTGCDLIRRKPDPAENPRKAVARVNNVLLYEDELEGIATSGVTKDDSTARVLAYVNSWIRKQLVMQEAEKKININEAEVERKILEYRYSLIGYEYQNFYIRKNLVVTVSVKDIFQYYKDHKDNFILKKNIVRATMEICHRLFT